MYTWEPQWRIRISRFGKLIIQRQHSRLYPNDFCDAKGSDLDLFVRYALTPRGETPPRVDPNEWAVDGSTWFGVLYISRQVNNTWRPATYKEAAEFIALLQRH